MQAYRALCTRLHTKPEATCLGRTPITALPHGSCRMLTQSRLATSAVISIPTLAYLLVNGPEKKSHHEHQAEAADKHGVAPAKPEEEIGEPKEPVPTSHTDTGDAESKGHVVGYKPEGVRGGHEDSEKGAQPQDNAPADQAKAESLKGKEDLEETSGKSSNDAAAGRSSGKSSGEGKNTESGSDKSSNEDGNEGGQGAGKKGKGEMDNDQESVSVASPPEDKPEL